MSGSNDKTIKIWNYETYELINTLKGHTDWVMSLLHIVKTKFIASGARDDTIKLWDYE